MLETKCVGDNYKMLLTLLAISVTNIRYLLTLSSGTNIQEMSSTSKFNRQQPQIIINITVTELIVHNTIQLLKYQLFKIPISKKKRFLP